MNANKKNGFTLIEILLTALISIGMVLMVSRIISSVRGSVNRGVVELQNLQSARNVMNYIRRDFMVAAPIVDPESEYEEKYRIKINPVLTEKSAATKSEPIFVAKNEIILYHRLLDNSVERIAWLFDQNAGTITRTSDRRGERVFPGIKKVAFKIFALHENLNQFVPLLWVSLTVDHQEGGVTKELELATSISSSIICKDINHQYWNANR